MKKTIKKMKTPADFLRLSSKDRKELMLDATKEATEMQREVMRRAEGAKKLSSRQKEKGREPDLYWSYGDSSSCAPGIICPTHKLEIKPATTRTKDGYCLLCGLSEAGMSQQEEKNLAKELKQAKKQPTGEMLFVDKRDAKEIRLILSDEHLEENGGMSLPRLLRMLDKIFNDSLKY